MDVPKTKILTFYFSSKAWTEALKTAEQVEASEYPIQ
jgi:hypothetical protein